MRLSFFDAPVVSPQAVTGEVKKLKQYRADVASVLASNDATRPEYSLGHAADSSLHDTLAHLKKRYTKLQHVLLIGIGGSSLGVEAVHAVLDNGKVLLTVLDTVSAHDTDMALAELESYKKLEHVAVCIISKSGGTTETLVNASIVLQTLEVRWGEKLYEQVVWIGDAGTAPAKQLQKKGATIVAMPTRVGGRYSVGTEVGLVPLALLQHDVDGYIEGLLDANTDQFESVSAESAARLALYIKKDYRSYNFFAFEKRLATLGAWYRQLLAESLGKAEDRTGKPVTKGVLPTISTPVELHSVGQLYLSGFKGVYTDIVTFDDETTDYDVPKQGIAKTFARFSAQEVATALYGGVVGAYVEKGLPHRATIFDDELPYSLGLFMGMRMREIIYVAELLNLNAFDQPNVELYKQKTKHILGL